MLIKEKSSWLPTNVALGAWRIPYIVLNKGKSAIPPQINGPEVLSLAPNKAKLFAKIFQITLILKTRESLYLFSLLELIWDCIIFPWLPGWLKDYNELWYMKASCPDCIPVVFLKNCESQLSYILAELFNMCLKESCFPDCWKVSSVVPVMLGKCLLLKTLLDFFLWLVKSLKTF